MAPKNNKAASGHDDVSGLFARLGTPASAGYQDFAHTQLPPRRPGVTQTPVPAAVEQTTAAADAVQTPAPLPAPAASVPSVQSVPAAHRSVPVEGTAGSPLDALAPLRKLRQLDEPAAPAAQPGERQAQTPLERLFQRLLQADAPSATQSPLQRLRSR
ncbi:hypothetical protein AE929_14785 [Xanthomonas arboricola]|uniref:Uncharacterized protein n=1 Tax=Xanthomonas campestris pv. juglandis TaxID=195709 RepID=A0A2N7V1G2_XANCJ|nr:hypothetical protein [Xanthomonas arboricola]KOB00329.1 hypothetical protein AE920_09655 [Xanthomonas arboricola]KOB15771.1 hypothetical protein AE924_10320 [Xanthomonas arboricola]KOB34677.1 hypothetical protein AE929_14785 [Xanthomonas arboricola]OAH85084.1 hypothetical protein AXA70_20565 [Xanthomonas arboricola pv. juglandis]PMR86534.1 hypothetical protein C1H21_12480 [Xanthomonas arboricola pv. juglandis]